MQLSKLWFVITANLIFFAAPGLATADNASAQSVDAGKYWINARLRNENIEQDNILEDASAVTLRTRIGYETRKYMGFQFLIEGENIFAIQDGYNSTTNNNTQYSVVADPEDTEINRVYLSYSDIPDTSVAVGRQKIILDNARFVGNVGWRQNEQTFDSLTVTNSSITDTTIKFAYIDKVRRIFGPDSPKGKTDMSSPLVNVTYKGFPLATVTAYGYFLEFNDTPANSQRTLGVSITGASSFEQVKLKYRVEFADQQDYQGGSAAIDASYYHVNLGAVINKVDLGVGIESLGGNGSYGFQTPLATGHAFNGWADQFLSTPANGLTDTYFSVGGKAEKLNLKAVYHVFKSDVGSQDYGSEFDLVATRKFGDHFLAGVKYANYSADQHGVDTQKLWIFAQFSYR